MPLLSNAWSDGGWSALWSRAEPVVRPVPALAAVWSSTVLMLVA